MFASSKILWGISTGEMRVDAVRYIVYNPTNNRDKLLRMKEFLNKIPSNVVFVYNILHGDCFDGEGNTVRSSEFEAQH